MWAADDVLGTALDWVQEGHPVAIATVVETWGSSPRPCGAQLVVRGDGAFHGSVSGGCVESDVIEAALRCLRVRLAEMLEFGVSNEAALQAGVACGGRVRIYVECVE
jgi:xanthine/CO dehydrogenase XdhC/CoxF family maturation factor